MFTIPLQPIPSQIVKVVLSGQNCQLNLYQKPQGLFVDISANDVNVVSGIIARDTAALIARDYVGFLGNLIFIDTQGDSDPNSTGLGGRFSLLYLTEAEYAIIR